MAPAKRTTKLTKKPPSEEAVPVAKKAPKPAKTEDEPKKKMAVPAEPAPLDATFEVKPARRQLRPKKEPPTAEEPEKAPAKRRAAPRAKPKPAAKAADAEGSPPAEPAPRARPKPAAKAADAEGPPPAEPAPRARPKPAAKAADAEGPPPAEPKPKPARKPARTAKAAAKKAPEAAPRARAPAKRASDSDVENESPKKVGAFEGPPAPVLPLHCELPNARGEAANLSVTSWNVAGLRAWVKKGGLEFLRSAEPDVFCLQETKCTLDQIPDEVKELGQYKQYWCCSSKPGYAGVGLLTKRMPIEIIMGIDNEEHDAEGRCLTAEFKKFYLINVYVPNAGRNLVTLDKRLDWNEAFKQFVKKLSDKKPVVICGDMNVAHEEIDLANPKTNKNHAGFTPQERSGMTDFLNEGFIDTFRDLYPEKKDAYTYWTYMKNCRAKNVGWRLDYFIISTILKDNLCDNVINTEILGSDHCPVTCFFNI